MLYEIAKEGVDIVPRRDFLRLFHNTISASKERLQSIVSEHRLIVRELYSADPEDAFSDVDPLSIPLVAEVVSREVLGTMKARLVKEQDRRLRAEKKASSAIKNSEEYERLKAQQKQRKAKAEKRLRAAQSRPGKKKKKKKK